MADSLDQALRCLHSAVFAEQVQSRSCILSACPLYTFIGRPSTRPRRVATPVVDVSGCTDELDRGTQLLIPEPALVLLPSSEPSPSTYTDQSNQCTDHASKEVAHRYTLV